MGGSKQDKSTTTTKPPQYISNASEDAIRYAQQQLQLVNTQPYTGGFFAQPTAGEFGAVQQGIGSAQQNLGLGNQVINYGQGVLGGKYLDPAQNQAFQGYVNQAVYDPLYSRLTDTVLPAIQSRAIAQGAYGGSANATGLSSAYRDTAAEAANQAARAGMQLYDIERRAQQLAPMVIGQGMQLNTQGIQDLLGLHAYGRGLAQLPLNEQKAQFEEANTAPLRRVAPYVDVIRGLSGGAGSTTTALGGQSGSPAGGALMGGLGGAASGAALGSVLAPGPGTLIGAIAGGLLGGTGGWFG